MALVEMMEETFAGGGPEPVLIDPQDAEILRALAAGSRPQQIAREWGVSKWCVYARIKRVRARLGVETTTQAVLAAAWMRAEGRM